MRLIEETKPMTTNSETEPRPRPSGSRPFLSSILDWLLLITVIAVWLAYFRTAQHEKSLRSEIATLQQVSRKLVVTDPRQIALIEQHPDWFAARAWSVYIPPRARVELRLATHNVNQNELPQEFEQIRLNSGQHTIQLSVETGQTAASKRVIVTVDGVEAIVREESEDWATSSYSENSLDAQMKMYEPHEPVIVLRRQYTSRTPGQRWSQDTGNGVLLWIAPAEHAEHE